MKSTRRSVAIFTAALGVAAVLAACGSTATTSSTGTTAGTVAPATTPGSLGSTPAEPVGGAVEIKVVTSPYGKALARGNGKVLYAWDKEVNAGDGKAQCTSEACVEKWPPLTATALTFGDGVDKSQFTLVDRPDGTKQVAVNGKRLYTMAIDEPGEANCQGTEGWWILNPDGSKNAATTPTGGTSPSGGTTPGTGGAGAGTPATTAATPSSTGVTTTAVTTTAKGATTTGY